MLEKIGPGLKSTSAIIIINYTDNYVFYLQPLIVVRNQEEMVQERLGPCIISLYVGVTHRFLPSMNACSRKSISNIYPDRILLIMKWTYIIIQRVCCQP